MCVGVGGGSYIFKDVYLDDVLFSLDKRDFPNTLSLIPQINSESHLVVIKCDLGCHFSFLRHSLAMNIVVFD